MIYFSVLDHSYITFPMLTKKFPASKMWITRHARGYLSYTNHSFSIEAIFDNTHNLY